MSATETSPSQELKGEDWAGEMGERWLANLDRLEGMLKPIGTALLKRAEYSAGDRVLDIGSGGGATTQAIAQRVAPNGEAIGVDVAPALVAEAKKRAAGEGIENARFVCADASSVRLDDAPFDRLFSRFGSMFFDDPIPAFANLRGLLRSDARIDLAVWGPPRENPWMMEMMSVVRQHVEIPPAEPRSPGPFAFEDLDYLGEVLSGAGFSQLDIGSFEGKIALGGVGADPQKAVEFVLSSMGVGRILTEQDDDTSKHASAGLLEAFERSYLPKEGVMMGCKVWLASAKA